MAAADAEKRPRVRVAALLLIDGKVVLVRHAVGDKRYHLLPGGGVEFGETLEAALVREVAEETQLAIEVGAPLLISDTIDPGGERHVVNITFAAKVVSGSIGRPEDPRVEAVELVDPQELTAIDLRPPMSGALQRVINEGFDGPARYLGSLFIPDRRKQIPDAEAT